MVKHSEIMDSIIQAGTLFHSATAVNCVAVDLVNHTLTAIPDESMDTCLCRMINDSLNQETDLEHVFDITLKPFNIQSQHVYHCPYGLANIIVPVYRGRAVVASLLAGPILDTEPEFLIHSAIASDIDASVKKEIFQNLSEMPRQTVNQIIALSEVLRSMTPQFTEEEPEPIPKARTYSRVIQLTLDYIHTHYNDKITLNDAAKATFVNPTYLSRLFNKEVKTSFTNYLNQYRVDKSMDLLLNSERLIVDICYLVGFENQSYYNKVFKQRAGRTPGQFKKELGNSHRREPLG